MTLRKLGSDWDIAVKVAAAVYSQEIAEFSRTFTEFVNEHGLVRIWEEKPLLNGSDVASLLGIAGPGVGKALEMVVKWQILNRTGTKEGCEEYLRANIGEIH